MRLRHIIGLRLTFLLGERKFLIVPAMNFALVWLVALLLGACSSGQSRSDMSKLHDGAKKVQQEPKGIEESTSNAKPSKEKFNVLVKEALWENHFVSKGVTDEGLLLIEKDGWKLTINTENVLRNYLRDGDEHQIASWIESILVATQAPKDWQDARSSIMFAAEPSGMDFDDTLTTKISPDLSRTVVFMSSENMLWVTKNQLAKWRTSEEDVLSAASKNMAKLMDNTPITVLNMDSNKVAVFETYSPLKASLIFSPNFKEKIKKKIGWPVYVVIPCRDFMYATASKDLAGRFGGTVLEEYQKSGYPLTTEILKVSDKGIEPIGKFASKAQ